MISVSLIILLDTQSLLQLSDLLLIACIFSHQLAHSVFEELHSDSQIHHQVHLVQTALLDASTSLLKFKLATNVWSDVVLDACHVLAMQRFVVFDLVIAFGDLVFELYIISKWTTKGYKKYLRLRVQC